MTLSYVARQPILDDQRQTFGYELLYRDGSKNSFPEIEPEKATSRLLSDNFLGASSSLLDGKLAFVNFPHQSIVNRVPNLLPKESVVIEILENCIPNDELYEAVSDLHHQGYRFALDDFKPSPEWRRFLPFVYIIKFDIRVFPIAKAKVYIDAMKPYKIVFLAEKVESYEEFELAKQAGFDLYQGYFFSRPEIVTKKAIQPNFATIVQLLQQISKRDIDFRTVEELISRDVSLSFKLLKFVNSSASVRSKITSFRQALAYLGEERLRRFISLVAIASTGSGKPNSLYSLSLQRARFAELICVKIRQDLDPSQAFLVGMFSLLDSLLDRPLAQLLNGIPLDQGIKGALLERSGELGNLLALIEAYEKADWENVRAHADIGGYTQPELQNCYEASMQWSTQANSVQHSH